MLREGNNLDSFLSDDEYVGFMGLGACQPSFLWPKSISSLVDCECYLICAILRVGYLVYKAPRRCLVNFC